MARGRSLNREVLERVARRIEPLLAEFVFVGGHLAELLVTHPAAVRPRVTDDVDVIVAVATRGEYHRLGERLRALQLYHDTSEGAPVCRWRTADGLVLDVMPVEEGVLGFANPWYGLAMDSAVDYVLAKDLRIRVATAPVFVATKWAAFAGRGRGDVFGSHDVEDIIAVVAGRPELVDELGAAPDGLRAWVAAETRRFLESGVADYAVEGALPDARQLPGVVDEVMERLRRIADASG